MKRIPLGVDTETHLFRAGNMAPRIVCVSSQLPGNAAGLLDRKEGFAWLSIALETAAVGGELVLTGHNFAYDMACALGDRDYGATIAPLIWKAYDAGAIQCTHVRERLIDIAKGTRAHSYSLDTIAMRRLKRKLDKESFRLGYGELEHVPIADWAPGARAYAMDDATAALDIWIDQENERERLFPNYREWDFEVGRQSAFSFALKLMSTHGIEIDQEQVQRYGAELLAKLAKCRETMLEAKLIDPKKGSRSIKLMRELIEKSWAGEGDLPRTGKGAVKTDADTIDQCEHPALVAASDYAHYEKMLSGFVLKLEDAGSLPIHAGYNVLVDTGRTSSYDPNIQQQPRDEGVRECFKAREGCVLIACDYDANEARTFAEVLCAMFNGRSNLAKRFREDPDYDPHSDLVSHQIGITYQEAIARKKAKDPAFKDLRQKAKAVIYGVPGGMGPKTLVTYARSNYGVTMTREEADALRAVYFQFEPVVRDYFNVIGNWTETGETQIEQLYSGRLRGACYFSRAANTLFQGLASDGAKSALWEVTKRCYGAPGTEGSPLFGCRPSAFLHDEILVEAPEAYAHEAAVELEKVMCEAMQELTPHVPARASPALMRRWSKSADAVFDKDGRYIAWEDRPKKEGKAA